MDRTNLRTYINEMCSGMKFKDSKQELEFKTKIEETFIKYEHLIDELDQKKSQPKKTNAIGRYFQDNSRHRTGNQARKVFEQLKGLIYRTDPTNFSIQTEWGRTMDSMARQVIGNMRVANDMDIEAENRPQEEKTEKEKNGFREGLKVKVDDQKAVDTVKAQEQQRGKDAIEPREDNEIGE